MRIAVVADAFPGVSETFVTEQARELARRGHDVVVVGEVPADPAATPAVLTGRIRHRRSIPADRLQRLVALAAVLVRVARVSPRRAVAFARCLVRARSSSPLGIAIWAEPLVVAAPFDAVVCHFGWNARNAALVRPALGTSALVAVLHGADLSSWAGADGPGRFAPVFEQADLLLPVSERWRRQLIDWGGPESRTLVQRIGIDLAAVHPAARPVGAALRLLSVARLVEKKGIESAVRAVAALGCEVRYDIVGDGPLRPRLEALVAELGLEDRVHLLGAQPPRAVRQLLARADVFLAPSVTAGDGDQEGIPVAIMEAMAAGLPVVSTHHSGIPELVEHGVTGLLVAERDVDGLAGALGDLSGDRQRRDRMGAAGRRAVAERHDNDALHDQLEQRLIDLVDRPDRSARAAPASRRGS
ncbi:MAG: colanic acid biosynthesis glycosyltransferase WcaL [Actinomycetia bacterium]|nr:colanic acid biosynthesis glycosyltransferase WcaL [Actinomycetes bacterium]